MHPYTVSPAMEVPALSPTTVSSPQVLTPATSSSVNRPLVPIPGSGLPQISLAKTWVLPPKPKPGRKPALDTPPTKRKAQNREAQRAFRERRAAKVGELEDEMKRIEAEDAKEQEELRARIHQLENSVREYEDLLHTWRDRCRETEIACQNERHARQCSEKEVERLKRELHDGTDAVPLPPRQPARTDYTQNQELEGMSGQSAGDQELLTCGNCTINTRCQCIEDALNMGDPAQDTSNFKRPHTPRMDTENKRSRQVMEYDPGSEIDFTAQFASRPPALVTSASTSSSIAATAPLDPCGFCSDGTSCICAEIINEGKRSDRFKSTNPSHPAFAPQDRNDNADPCAKGPGTCDQCMSDPTSKAFCQSVAASRPIISRPTTRPAEAPIRTKCPTHSRLDCAAAYTMLSQHPSFDIAKADMSSWVPQLAVIPKSAIAPERTAFDIEAASIMSVLKVFDRRFGSEVRPSTPVSEGEAPRESKSEDPNEPAWQAIAYDGEKGAKSVKGPDMRSWKNREGDP